MSDETYPKLPETVTVSDRKAGDASITEYISFYDRALNASTPEDAKKWVALHREEKFRQRQTNFANTLLALSIVLLLAGAFGFGSYSRHRIQKLVDENQEPQFEKIAEIDDSLMQYGAFGLGIVAAILSPNLMPLVLKIIQFAQRIRVAPEENKTDAS
ncbi:MAG: hypothetical protein AAFY72_03930 [Cyanobacteria bacterium J06649_4]